MCSIFVNLTRGVLIKKLTKMNGRYRSRENFSYKVDLKINWIIYFQLFETSAKENINVEEMFRAVTELVLKSKLDKSRSGIPTDPHSNPIRISSQRPGAVKDKKNKNSCCKWKNEHIKAERAHFEQKRNCFIISLRWRKLEYVLKLICHVLNITTKLELSLRLHFFFFEQSNKRCKL